MQTVLCQGPTTAPVKPVLKWAGGKTQLLKVLLSVLPQFAGRYIEPFLGGGALFFHLAPCDAVVSDSNEELVQFYAVVRDYPEELARAASDLTVSRESYYELRSARPDSMEPIARASRFLYLNKTCYNGLHRVNRRGEFNTPFGGRTDVRVVDVDNLCRASQVLKRVDLRCADYRAAIDGAKAGDFVYLDPPYLPVGRYSDFKRYTREFFGEQDHALLAKRFRDLTQRGVLALLSNSASPAVEQLYSGFPMRRVQASRQINCRAGGRGRVTELLIANFDLDMP